MALSAHGLGNKAETGTGRRTVSVDAAGVVTGNATEVTATAGSPEVAGMGTATETGMSEAGTETTGLQTPSVAAEGATEAAATEEAEILMVAEEIAGGVL